MRETLEWSPGVDITADRIRQLRSNHVSPLELPNTSAEELNLLAALSIVIDLLARGWRIAETDPAVVLTFANGTSPEIEKERIRCAHLVARDSQLTEPAVAEFVKGMEKRRLTTKGWHSIFSLMRDGDDLARALRQVCEAPTPEAQAELLARSIRPYVQFVETDAVCAHTGLKLNDIWRYFRHTWVNSYKSVPGRSMMILVRDEAAPNHPVIGIACLASSVVQQKARDQWIGWDSETAIERLRKSHPKKAIQWLMTHLASFIRGIYIKDLLTEKILARSDVSRPTEMIIGRLLKDADRSIKQHRRYPNAAKHKGSDSLKRAEWIRRAETSLFRSKRSKQLATLLSIRQLFQRLRVGSDMTPDAWQHLFQSGSFRQAVSQIVRLVKAERVGIKMMDITVCGAVAPYNLLLGGKAICLLLCGPEIVREYKARYGKQISLIASCMRGASVQRKADLVLLCTTSLYGSALSQYSRVKVPARCLGGRQDEKIEYQCLGLSEGFGSFQFSKETVRMLEMLLGRAKNARKVNSIFGEGVNPLMRKIREGLSLLGLPADVLLRHGNKRVVYGVALARNFREFLLDLSDSPQYVGPQTRVCHRTELLADFWRRRWVLKRLSKPGILEEIARHTYTYPIRHGAKVPLPIEGEEMLGLWANAGS